MEKEIAYSFDYMYQSKICSTVTVFQDGTIKVDDKVDSISYLPFGCWSDQATLEDVENLFESRCFPRTRANCRQLLQDADIQFYNPIEIVRKTEGRLIDDKFWIRFHEEED